MASKGVNKVILIGNLGADPELRYMPNNVAVANFTLATSESGEINKAEKIRRRLNGTESLFITNWLKLPENICVRGCRFILKESYKPENGRINKGKSIIQLKLLWTRKG